VITRNGQRATLLATLLWSASAQSEVIDKIASIGQIWVTNSVIAAVAALAAYALRKRIASLVVVFALAVVFAWPPVVPIEFLQEAEAHYGSHYSTHAQAAALMVPIAALLGFIFGGFTVRRTEKRNAA
jgi:hypothetical protein